MRSWRLSRGWLVGLALCVPLVSATARGDKARIPPPPKPAQAYEMVDAHPNEHVTIAAEPGDTKATRPNTRLDYFSHQMMPVRVIVTNDSEFTVTLDDARIHLITADNTVLPAATLDDLQRRMFTMKSATGTKIPLGIPIPITVGKSDIDKKITQDDQDFGFQTTEVKPHTTVAGWLYYDMQDTEQPFLNHATLELKKVRFVGSGQVLDSFEIQLRPAKDADKE
jgi:hypothetical protein